MDLLLFSGNSPRNKSWIYKVRDSLTPLFITSQVHEYTHWESGEAFIDFTQELAALPAETTLLGTYVVFAKSVGTVLTAQAIYEGLLHPQQCVFVGLPLMLIKKQQYSFADWLREYTGQVTFIQNARDPLGSYEEVKNYVRENKLGECLCIELPGDTHDYEEFSRLRQVMSLLIKER